jgi:RNA polymerase sigma factor (sigma-70 family)
MAHHFDGREDVFNALYDAHYAAVRAYAWRRDPACADDIVAETFLVAWRRLDDVPRDWELPWLLAVARNTYLNIQRGERRRSQRESSAARLEEVAEVQHDGFCDGDDRVLQLLTHLSPPDQEVLRLLAWEGLDRSAIARVLGCSRANVAVRLHRARRRLQALLAEADQTHVIDGTFGPAEHRCRLVEGGLQND